MVTYLSYSPALWSHNTFFLLDFLQLCFAAVCILACLSLPRRPVVEEKGTLVDGQYTASAFDRYTFAWAGTTLVLARNKKTLDLDDMPKLHVEGRSAYRLQYFSKLKIRDQLWKTLLFAHLPELMFQTLFTAFQCVSKFIPQLFMYLLLKRLESRTEGNSSDLRTWGLVVALGMAILLSGWTLTWLAWIVWARLGQPIRTELSAMIFGKATRRKDVKGMQKSKQATDIDSFNGTGISTAFPGTNDQKTTEAHPISGPSPGQAETAKAEEALEEDVEKSRQSTINLVVRICFPRRTHNGRMDTDHGREWMQNVSQILLFSIICSPRQHSHWLSA